MTDIIEKGEFIKLFRPYSPDVPKSAGRLVIHTTVPTDNLSGVDALYEALVNDAQRFQPPLHISREETCIVQYSSALPFRHIIGLEVQVSGGYTISADYTVVNKLPNIH
ncbi:MAG TPA: hypothetical protein VFN56_01710 [Candidatus Saccharimonadales bacterium]|nr:hypothetical protein [Candidatus Saccharimonadales bacterium]